MTRTESLQKFMKIGWELTIGEKHVIQVNLTGSIIKIVTCHTDMNNRRNSKGDNTTNTVPSLSLLEATKHVFVIIRVMNYWHWDRSSSLNCLFDLSVSCLLWFYKINDVETHRKREKISRFPSVITLVVVRTTKNEGNGHQNKLNNTKKRLL